jgi:hypothetical protein
MRKDNGDGAARPQGARSQTPGSVTIKDVMIKDSAAG